MALFDRLFSKGKKDKKIDSFEKITLNLSGMRYMTEFELLMKDGKAEVSQYGFKFVPGKDQRVLQKRVTCDAQTALELLNGCNVLSWDGFYGAHPRGVKDGTMFTLKATVNEGKSIYASGSQNFPRNFDEFTDGLHKILSDEGK